jgi:7-carboxy-7-deazaguanine synthase
MKYALAEKFKAPQGEGDFTGTPMAFIRFLGCSVGQKICTSCDTDFLHMNLKLGGGVFELEDLLQWVGNYEHVCLTGGEPLDRSLLEFIEAADARGIMTHIETSGTVLPDWLFEMHNRGGTPQHLWITVSPKPGYNNEMLIIADELKVIVGGLGDGPGWPTIDDAAAWAQMFDKSVYIQPRNEMYDVNMVNLSEVLRLLDLHPSLKLSVQLHKFLRTR